MQDIWGGYGRRRDLLCLTIASSHTTSKLWFCQTWKLSGIKSTQPLSGRRSKSAAGRTSYWLRTQPLPSVSLLVLINLLLIALFNFWVKKKKKKTAFVAYCLNLYSWIYSKRSFFIGIILLQISVFLLFYLFS